MDSPQLTGVPTGRRLPYGMATSVNRMAAAKDTRKAWLKPGTVERIAKCNVASPFLIEAVSCETQHEL